MSEFQRSELNVTELVQRIHPGWDVSGVEAVLADVLSEAEQGQQILPEPPRILRALEMAPEDVRVLIVGQDPYPTPGHAVGLSFSAEIPAEERLPKSLANIFAEYQTDLGLDRPTSGDLTPWAEQGVMLLNRVLTVRAGQPASHHNRGWEQITESVVRQVAARSDTVAILWGKPAQKFAPLFGEDRVIASPHPSPLSAYRGFFGSHPFTRANEVLRSLGATPVDWTLNR